jgi:protein-S-isoprenylcysteine O-methyltransferase Ste14
MPNEIKKLTAVQIIQIASFIIIFPAIFLFLAGDLYWIEGWIFIIWFIVMCFAIGAYMYRHDPALLAERQKMPGAGNEKALDKYIGIACALSFVALLVIMPLDAKRFGWSPFFPVWLKVLGGMALLPALFFLYQSVVENTFASTLVRVQSERKQHVIFTGVYGFVRHPLYLGDLFLCVGAPLLMGSLYGLIIGLIGTFLIAGRIIGEERMLVNELEGYEDYKKKVRYRLIPFIW